MFKGAVLTSFGHMARKTWRKKFMAAWNAQDTPWRPHAKDARRKRELARQGWGRAASKHAADARANAVLRVETNAETS